MRAGVGAAAAAMGFVLMTLLPAAGAVPAEAELRVRSPLDMAGDVRLAAPEGLLLLPRLGALEGGAERLNITLVREVPPRPHHGHEPLDPLTSTLPPLRPPPAPQVRYLEMAAPERLVFSTWQAGARAVLAVGPYDSGALALRGPQASVRDADPAALGALPETFAGEGARLHAEAPGHAEARGTVRGLLAGAGFVVQNATAALQVDATARDGARWTALLRWSGAALSASSDQPLALVAPLLHVDLDGELRSPSAWGGVDVGEARSGATGQALLAQGTMAGSLEPGAGAMSLRAQGELAYLALGESRQDFRRAAAAGAGVAVLSALAYYAQHLRFLAAPLYARIAPAELLDNDVRRRVHAHVAAHPGADVKTTALDVGVSWSTAAYHLARLEREGVLVSRRSGRSKRFFLNGGVPAGRAEAIGALRNPTALAVAELVAQRPGLMQKEIGAALGLPPSTVSWHMRRLRALGVVQEVRKWRRAEYSAGPVWREVAHAARDGAAAPPPLPPAGPSPPPGTDASSVPVTNA